MQPEPAPAPPLLAALVGVLGSLALLALAAVVACLACRRRRHGPGRAAAPLHQPAAATQLEPLRTGDGAEDGAEDSSEDRGPDVVPEGEDTDTTGASVTGRWSPRTIHNREPVSLGGGHREQYITGSQCHWELVTANNT